MMKNFQELSIEPSASVSKILKNLKNNLSGLCLIPTPAKISTFNQRWNGVDCRRSWTLFQRWNEDVISTLIYVCYNLTRVLGYQQNLF